MVLVLVRGGKTKDVCTGCAFFWSAEWPPHRHRKPIRHNLGKQRGLAVIRAMVWFFMRHSIEMTEVIGQKN